MVAAADDSTTVLADPGFAPTARAQQVARNLQTPENLGRGLASDVVELVASRGDELGEEVTLSANITIRPADHVNSDGTAVARASCLHITLCYEDPIGMQSVCRDAYIC